MEKPAFIVVDKPRNMLSHEISSYIKKMLDAKKAGHAGTLDPEVSGVLIVGLNRATKLLRFLTSERKTYVGVIEFKEEKEKKEIEQLFSKFRGKISQIPPKESAVARRKRQRNVYELKIIEIEGKKVLFKAEVEAGTYIRTLCKDMGGKMIDLRRIKSGAFEEREAYTMDEIYTASILDKEGYDFLIEEVLLEVEEVFHRLHYPVINIAKHTAKNVVRGAPIYENGIIEFEKFKKNELVSIFSEEKFIGIGKALCNSEEKCKKIIAPEKIHATSQDLM